MWELERLKLVLKKLEEELDFLTARENELLRKLSVQGYSLKRIKGNVYLYTWTTVGHGKAKWKCLGNVKKKPDLIERIRDMRAKEILEELNKIEERREELRDKFLQAFQALSS